jgi:hypothetical protein
MGNVARTGRPLLEVRELKTHFFTRAGIVGQSMA